MRLEGVIGRSAEWGSVTPRGKWARVLSMRLFSVSSE